MEILNSTEVQMISILDNIIEYEKGLKNDGARPQEIYMGRKTYEILVADVVKTQSIKLDSTVNTSIFGMRVMISELVPEGKVVFKWDTGSASFNLIKGSEIMSVSRFMKKRMIRMEKGD